MDPIFMRHAYYTAGKKLRDPINRTAELEKQIKSMALLSAQQRAELDRRLTKIVELERLNTAHAETNGQLRVEDRENVRRLGNQATTIATLQAEIEQLREAPPHVVHQGEPPVVMTTYRDTVVIARGRDIFQLGYDHITDQPMMRQIGRV